MSSDLELLPRFRIRTIETQENGDVVARGELDGWVRDDGPRWFWLWISDDEAIIPRVEDEAEDDDEVTVRIDSSDLRFAISEGEEYPWLHAYWQAYHVTMIRRGEWEQREFVPQDAIHFELDGVHGWTRADGRLRAGAKMTGIEEGGWDHAHCELCNARIGQGEFVTGYVDPDEHWLCPPCYTRWAKPRDLGFLVSGG